MFYFPIVFYDLEKLNHTFAYFLNIKTCFLGLYHSTMLWRHKVNREYFIPHRNNPQIKIKRRMNTKTFMVMNREFFLLYGQI